MSLIYPSFSVFPIPSRPNSGGFHPSLLLLLSRFATSFLHNTRLCFLWKVRRVFTRVYTPPPSVCLPLLALSSMDSSCDRHGGCCRLLESPDSLFLGGGCLMTVRGMGLRWRGCSAVLEH
ncbi:hypothetical protein C1H46_039697 [Malus baccata]|uniref:Uncharacterized protein n=1 Tax=Malus baccata TaxID=106549 RepID=A0A540KKN8_MALBA|nr:hypothetical protein C1H46_039697 [Malus baccata]